MSAFVHGPLFWGGIGLLSIPIILHIINRRRFRRLDWAAMEFLLEALRRNRRRIRLEHLILLLLRTLLVLLIVAAVARPHLSQGGFGWLSGPFRSEEKVFVIDDSLSMGHREAGQTSLQRAVAAVLQGAERIAADGGGDALTVLRSSSYQAPLFNAVNVDAERLDNLRRQLDPRSFESTAVRLDLAAALDDLAASATAQRGRALSIVTDLCRSDWTDGQGRPIEALRRALERVAGDADNPTRIVIFDVGSRSRDNLAITDFALDERKAVAGISVDLRIELTNYGRATLRDVGVRLRTAGSVGPGPRTAAVEPGATVTLKVPHVFREPGTHWVEVEIEAELADGLDADDRRGLVVEVVDSVEVLIIDGEPSGIQFEGETDFLAQALRPAGELSSGYAPTLAVEANLPTEGLERFGVIFLANLARLPEAFARRLSDYVRGGGGLVIFVGDQVDPNVYERAFGSGSTEGPAVDLLPANLGELRGDPLRPAHIAPSFDHDAFRLLAGGGEALFRLVDVIRFRELEPGPSSRVIASLTDADESPFAVERLVGKGRVVLFAVSADLEWTNWPKNPSYLPVILDLAASMLRIRGADWNRAAGPPVDVPVDLSRHQREGVLRDPDYPNTAERRLLASTGGSERDGETDEDDEDGENGDAVDDTEAGDVSFRFRIEDTRRAGIYSLTLKTVDGNDEIRRLAIDADPAESDLTAISAEELTRLYEGIPLEVLRDVEGLAGDDRGHFEIADALLALFLIVLLVEGTLAWWFAHHRAEGRRGSAVGPRATCFVPASAAVRDRRVPGREGTAVRGGAS